MSIFFNYFLYLFITKQHELYEARMSENYTIYNSFCFSFPEICSEITGAMQVGIEIYIVDSIKD